MKREIKFKSYVKLMDGSIKSYIWLPFSCDEQEADMIVHNESVIAYGLQFTGLKDKNGKEIYEGDIVKHNGIYTSDPLIIEFHHGAFCIGKDGINTTPFKSWVTMRDAMSQANKISIDFIVEVIGNIYENPELI